MGGPPDIPAEDVKKLAGFVRKRVGSPEEAEDILQEVFLALVARWNLGEMIEDALAWLFRTAWHKIVDGYRRKRRAPRSLSPAADLDLDGRDLWEIADARTLTPPEAMEREEVRRVILKALEALPPEQREVLVLHEVEGMPFREIASRTGAPLNTLLSRKRYALRKLRIEVENHLHGREEV